ncbi:MAG: hypothetical protein MZV70_33555 [Desulfobacterales bacterium]|nr:hypothetical protein [Desulfobacterales bacterium]
MRSVGHDRAIELKHRKVTLRHWSCPSPLPLITTSSLHMRSPVPGESPANSPAYSGKGIRHQLSPGVGLGYPAVVRYLQKDLNVLPAASRLWTRSSPIPSRFTTTPKWHSQFTWSCPPQGSGHADRKVSAR